MSADKSDWWNVMLFAAEADVIVICVEYFILVFMIAVFASLVAFFSGVESGVRSILSADLLLMGDCWHSLLRIWSWSLFLESKTSSQWLQEDLSHVTIWLWFNSRLIDENEAEQMVHLWYFCLRCCGVVCGVDLEDNWIGDSFLNLIINTFMHLARFASFRLDWYHMYAAPRRHFESSCIMSASWYWSHGIWFTNMFTSWYRRSFGKSYCSEESKKSISFGVGFSFWISFGVGTFFSLGVFLITFVAIRVGGLRLCNNDEYGDRHLGERLTCFVNALSCDFHSLSFNLHSIYSTLFGSPLVEVCLNSIAARSLGCGVDEVWGHGMEENVKVARRSL